MIWDALSPATGISEVHTGVVVLDIELPIDPGRLETVKDGRERHRSLLLLVRLPGVARTAGRPVEVVPNASARAEVKARSKST